MIWLFNRTAAMAVAGYVLLAGLFVGGIAFDVDLFPFFIFAFLIPFVIEVAAVFLSVKLYSDHLDIANTDIEAFLARDQRLYRRARGKTRLTILEDEIIVLNHYRRISRAQALLPELAQMIAQEDLTNRYLYVSILMSIDTAKRNFLHMDAHIGEKRALISAMRNRVNPKFLTQAEFSLELSILEAEFYSRSVQRLRNEDIALTQRYLGLIAYFMERAKTMRVLKNYTIMALDYEAGVAYAVSGQEQMAREYMQRVVSTGYKYPVVARAEEYLSTGDPELLMAKPELK